MGSRDVALALQCRRDITDGALESCAEAQGVRTTSIRGYFGLYTVSIQTVRTLPVEP